MLFCKVGRVGLALSLLLRVPNNNLNDFLGLAENTHQVLLAGGTEGCCVYFMDKATESSFSSWMENAERA
jgi:hypothetical protein